MNKKISINEKFPTDNKILRQFGIIMAIMIPVFFSLILPKIFGHAFHKEPLLIGVLFLAASLSYPKILKYIYIIWMIIGGVLGFINSRIILSLVYFILFTPFAIFFKLIGKDPLSRTFDKTKKSYRIEPEQDYDPKDIKYPY